MKITFIKLKLPSGDICLIDKEDYSLVAKYKWHKQGGYAKSEVGSRKLGTRGHISMHRLIMGAKEGRLVDHINLNKLDNRKDNLRFCDKSTNGMNRTAQSNSKTGIKGVCWSQQKNRWRVTINKMGKQYHVGFFSNIKDAEEASVSAINLIHKQFARI